MKATQISHSYWSHRFYTWSIYPGCNYRVVIDHTIRSISLNLTDFTDLFLLEMLTSLPLLFDTLWLKSVTLRLENYLELSRFFPCDQPNSLRDTKRNAFFLSDFWIKVHHRSFLKKYMIYPFSLSNYYHSFLTQSATIIMVMFTWSGNICHHTQKCTETRLDSFIKYLIRQIFAGFCCRKGISCPGIYSTNFDAG